MPDPRPLNALRAQMALALSVGHGHRDPVWGEPKLMTAALRGVMHVFGGNNDSSRPPKEDMVGAVRSFIRSGKVATFTELKYVCYGVAVPVDIQGQRLIDYAPLLSRLLELVDERKGQPNQFQRCYQGLLSGYFSFVHQTSNPKAAKANWLKLREFLEARLKPVVSAAKARDRHPDWLQTLTLHNNLLGEEPCVRYAEALRRGDRSVLAAACSGLGIEPSSWVWHEAVLAYVREVVDALDKPFQMELPQLLSIVDGQQAGLHIPLPVAREAVALIVARYSKCLDKPEQAELRDVCLRRIGNPWLERGAWDSAVKSEAARAMIESWLKRRLIKDFFSLLAHDDAADPRRLDYWLKWEPKINDMWFVLGFDARRNRDSKFVEVRNRMAGRERSLTADADYSNNAFVMRIGQLLVIEFGMTGNACFAFSATEFRTSLDQMSLSIRELKQKPHAARMSHTGQWEAKFDIELRSLLARIPVAPTEAIIDKGSRTAASSSKPVLPPSTPLPKITSAPTSHGSSQPAPDSSQNETARKVKELNLDELEKLCRNLRISLEDNRAKGAELWVRLLNPESNSLLRDGLIEQGFKFVAGKGFYIEADE